MAKGQHDTIAYRLSHILTKLNEGEKLDPDDLAREFGVHVRTIQRDLRARLAHLHLTRTKGRYELGQAHLGKLSFKDIERFADLAGVQGLFPSLSGKFLRSTGDGPSPAPWLVKGHHYENLDGGQTLFRQLEAAVTESRLLDFEMASRTGAPKAYKAVAPYRLLNIKGIWYLAAVDRGRYKTFGIGRMQRLLVTQSTFHKDPVVESAIEKQEGVWHSDNDQEVLLAVAAPAARYFKRRQLVPNQAIGQEFSDGSLHVRTTAGHPTQILPVVRYWLPHLRIISPAAWQQDLEQGLKEYLTAGRGPTTSPDPTTTALPPTHE